MPRRTKEDAQKTRQAILVAAAEVFHARGVARTSLDEIAIAARVTRGAVYWHFKNKSELFFALREQEALPLIDGIDVSLLDSRPQDPLAGIERALLGVIEALSRDPVLKRSHQILAFRCEYVGDLAAAFDRVYRAPRKPFLDVLAAAYRRASAAGQLRSGLKPAALAADTAAFVSGMVTDWLVDDGEPAADRKARKMIREHIALRRA